MGQGEHTLIPEAIRDLLRRRNGHSTGEVRRCFGTVRNQRDQTVSSESGCRGEQSTEQALGSAEVDGTLIHSGSDADGVRGKTQCSPAIRDPFLAKLVAVELAGDLASSLLNVAYVISERLT